LFNTSTTGQYGAVSAFLTLTRCDPIFKTPSLLMQHARPIAIAGAFAGGLLFAYTLHAAGPALVVGQIRQIGLGFVAVLFLSGIRMAVRSQAWSLCVDSPERFTFRDALAAFITGDAVGNVTPLGPVASESTKAILSGRNLPAADAVSSVVLENIFYSLSVAVMVGAGTLAFLLGFRPTEGPLVVTIGVSLVALIAIAAVWWLLRNQPEVMSRFLKHDVVRNAEKTIFRFASAHRDRLGRILVLEFAFHAAAVLEIYVLLWLLVGHSGRTLLLAVILETVERVITIAFKVVPLRMGVDQAGSGLVAGMVGIGTATGVTIATVRTARNLCWAAIGLALLLKSGVSIRKAG
jgi:Lysylphosphatidylglycerol synthase TM region